MEKFENYKIKDGKLILDNLTVGGYLYLRGTAITQLPDNLTVGGGLDLRGTAITQLPDNLTVGGGLDLQGTAITQLPDNLTVGGYLDLRGTAITQLPDNLTVGGGLDLQGTAITQKYKQTEKKKEKLEKLPKQIDTKVNITIVKNEFVYGDKIVTHVKGKKVFGDNTFYIGKIKGKNVVIAKDGTIAHGKDLESCLRGLAWKRADREGLKKQYEKMTLDSVVKHDEALVMYRIITGACEHAYDFADSLPKEKVKAEYAIQEIIEIVGDSFGASIFRRFFEKENEE